MTKIFNSNKFDSIVISYRLFHSIKNKNPEVSEDVNYDIHLKGNTAFCSPCHAISRPTRKRII